MASLDVLAAFVVTTALFAFIPGPAMLYAAARTMAGGRQAGLMAVFGIHIGSYAHIVAAAAGLSVLFHAVPIAYAGVKLAGAGYLVWLGISMFRAGDGEAAAPKAATPLPARRAFGQSIMVEVLNPKTAIFFTAFLPQFVDAGAALPISAQFALLGTAVNLMFTLADLTSVVLAEVILARLGRAKGIRKLAQRAGGSVLIGLGAHIALQKS
jgi:threonine/homoserine/homoserine lactone efflux protein